MDDPVVQIAGIVVLAVASNLVASRLRIPSILLLLIVGILIGPVLQVADPDALLGDLLTPFVSLAVGMILFEGGLSLRIREVQGQQNVIWRLVTIGVLVTWVVGAFAAEAFTDLSRPLAVLLGSIIVVSGPTVIGPILQSVKPSRSVGSILKWESIFVDPIGAMLAVITFDVIVARAGGEEVGSVLAHSAGFILDGAGFGALFAVVSIFLLRRHVIPEHLLSLFGVAMALMAFVAANAVVHEAGLLATTVLGLILSNHHRVRTEQILRFSEIIRVLLIGVLFIVLSARLTREQLGLLGPGTVGVILALVLVARPLAVWVSTLGSDLGSRERVLLAGVAPRGIVAASIASVFGLQIEEVGLEGAEALTPVAFAVIVATVVVYGLGAGPLARRLGLAKPSQEGVLILGAGSLERDIAAELATAGIEVVVATTNRADHRAATARGLRGFYGNILDEDLDLQLELSGIGRLLAMTPNDEINTLATRRFAEVFGGSETFQLVAAEPPPGVKGTAADLGGRELFGQGLDHDFLSRLHRAGAEIRRTRFTESFTVEDFRTAHGADAIPMFLVQGSRLSVEAVDADRSLFRNVEPGDVLIWMESAIDEDAYDVAREQDEADGDRRSEGDLEERGSSAAE